SLPPRRSRDGRARRRVDGRRESRGSGAGPDGVRPARAWRPLDHRRRPFAEDAVGDEPEDQVPRVVPAVCAGRNARARCRVVRDRRGQPVHAPRGRRAAVAAPAGPRGCKRSLGHRQAQRPALDDSGRHARRLLGAHPDGPAGYESRVLRHHRRLFQVDRLSGHRQHVVQRPRRAYRLHAGGRIPLLHAHQHGCARPRELPPAEGRPAGAARRRIVAEGVRARLTTTALSDRAERMSWSAYFELLMNLTKREVKGRYSQSFFGFAWAIVQPLSAMVVFTIVFSRVAGMPSEGVPYPVFAYAALVPFFFFSNSVSSGTLSLITYRNIVTKTYFPREIVPLAQVCSRFIDFFAAAALYALLMTAYGGHLGGGSLRAPVVFLLLIR